ncbi:hypothetical protein L914_18599 [Phytophthora nicotianae]|uniref:Uncharacterized protein n=1 Tax=Phytophthora nicotianae TaxID=4792 RepID=W2MD83_PHYNI|nr:hypothetical protein L914_18599 [Phytophthora nicotianae]
MTRGSPEYERLVRNVIDEGLIATWARNQPSCSSPRTDRHSRPSNTRRSTRERTTASSIPDNIKAVIPVVNDKVFDYVTNKHGDLKPGHPNVAN